MTSLYEIADNYRELENMDLDSETLADTLESIEGEFDDKADAICHVLANLKAMEAASAIEVARLLVRRKGFGDRQDSLKEYLRVNMEKLGKKKIESAKFTINCVAGRDKVNVLDEAAICAEFYVTKPAVTSLDKVALLKFLKNRKDDGNEDFYDGAELIKSKSSLRIK